MKATSTSGLGDDDLVGVERERQDNTARGVPLWNTCFYFPKIPLLIAATFALGVLVGRIDVMLPIFRTSEEYVPSCAPVSYSFLKTSLGRQILEELVTELEQAGPKAALQEVARRIDQDAQIASSCHPLAHQLGKKAWQELGLEGAFDGL